jgi:ketosteroid isomerase-like protein
MSQENVEIVLAAVERFEEGKRFRTRWAEDALVTAPDGWPEAGPFRGRDAILRQFERLRSDWDENRFREIEVLADEGEWVVIRGRWQTRGAGSGIENEVDVAMAFRVRNGHLVEGHARWDPSEALKVAGLPE